MFKTANLNKLVDGDFISERENLYLGLTADTLSSVSSQDIENFVGTDATLVTRLSHSVMRYCVTMQDLDHDSIVEQWLEDESKVDVELPSIIALTLADFPDIRARIKLRQQAGMKEEKFWGFNSPFFLNQYQEAWKKTAPALARAGLNCITLDTSVNPPEAVLEVYKVFRKNLTTE
jgi:hypothetical protein